MRIVNIQKPLFQELTKNFIETQLRYTMKKVTTDSKGMAKPTRESWRIDNPIVNNMSRTAMTSIQPMTSLILAFEKFTLSKRGSYKLIGPSGAGFL